MTSTPLRTIAAYFTRLGFTAFGGPLAHIAMMEEQTVRKRGWLSGRQFADALALCQLLPGPVSTQLAIHIGYLRGGFPGAIAAGTGFILPAFFMMLGLSFLYWRYGSLPAVSALFYGLNPAVIALIAAAALRLGRASAHSRAAVACVGTAFLARTLLGIDEILILLGLGMLGAFAPGGFTDAPGSVPPSSDPPRSDRSGSSLDRQGDSIRMGTIATAGGVLSGFPLLTKATGGAIASGMATGVLLLTMAIFFLKAGAFMFGGGYVIVPLMETFAVEQAVLMNRSQFLDGIALGQVTPGPILITATFVGYRAAGLAGSAVATAAVFLPSFVWILVCVPYLHRLGGWRRGRGFLAAANPAAVGTIAAAAWSLGRSCLIDSATVVIATAVLTLALRGRASSFLLILGAAAAGVILS